MSKWICSHCSAINPNGAFKCHNCPNTCGDEYFYTTTTTSVLKEKFPPRVWYVNADKMHETESDAFENEYSPGIAVVTKAEHAAIVAPLVEALEFYAERKVMEHANQFPGDDELIDVSDIAKAALAAYREKKEKS